MRVVIHHPAGSDPPSHVFEPRADLLTEVALDGLGGDVAARFGCAEGPFRSYDRTVRRDPDGGVTEEIRARLAMPVFAPLFWVPIRMSLRRPGRRPPWAPADRFDARTTTVLCLLAALAMVDGYVGTVMTQTATFAAQDFGASHSSQGTALAVARTGVLLSIVLAARADRIGRRILLPLSATIACVATAGAALSPNLATLTVMMVIATGAAGAVGLLVGIVAAEEVPAGSRAYAYSLLVMSSGLGAGVCIWVLPVADMGRGGWRVVYAVALLGLSLALLAHRRLPESRRFVRPHAASPSLRDHSGRLILLAAAGFLAALFVAPAFQFQNDYLRTVRGFSAARISMFTIATGTPAVIGIVVGGRLADRRGRRAVGAVGTVTGALLLLLSFTTGGWALWAWATAGGIGAGMTVPSLGVYRPELFPTGLRGRAAGVIEAIALTGSGVGLLVVGRLVDQGHGYAAPLALMAVGPVLLAVLVLTLFPETARRELEDLNPEDGVE